MTVTVIMVNLRDMVLCNLSGAISAKAARLVSRLARMAKVKNKDDRIMTCRVVNLLSHSRR